MTPGIYPGLPMSGYIAMKAVNAGTLRTLLDRCPAAARYESPWNPSRRRDDTAATDAGSIAHAILLEGSEDGCQVFNPADYPNAKGGGTASGWTNNAIREARDACRASGRIPILADDMHEVRTMVASGRAFIESLAAREPAIWKAFQPNGGRSEVTLVWQEGETLCKARTDRFANDNAIIVDYKSSSMSVEPDRWGRTQLVSMGYYMSASWYRRGVRALTGVDPDYVFLCGELSPPYLHSLIGVDPAGLALGDEKCGAALREWQKCTASGEWPGYPARVCYVETPVWERARWDERNGVDEHGIPYDLTQLWGAPRDPFKKEAA